MLLIYSYLFVFLLHNFALIVLQVTAVPGVALEHTCPTDYYTNEAPSYTNLIVVYECI